MKAKNLLPPTLTILLSGALLLWGAALAESHPPEASPTLPNRPAVTYAVVINQSTYADPGWAAVADVLLAKYDGQLFLWDSSLYEIQADLADYHPTHVGLVCEMATASYPFVQATWPFMRTIDGDPYCDAVWGIITGCTAEDALTVVTGPDGFEVTTALSGTSSCEIAYYTQGISTNEATYGRYYVKHPDSTGTTQFDDGPTDRTAWLVSMLNEGIDIFDYAPVDIFYTSGHGGHNMWQMHYPDAGYEGYFRSSDAQAYGDPYAGANININSDHPRIFFGLGNCYIGRILYGSSMAPAWIRTAGAYQYTGYTIAEGSTSHHHGGTKAYFYRVARSNTWAESWYLGNQALRFDIINNTPGANPPDLDGSALYGDPGLLVTMSHEGAFVEPLFDTDLTIIPGVEQDSVTFRITMNRDGRPGYTSKWGERHPAMILPFRAENVEVIYTDAMTTVVEDDFVLLYIWYSGQPDLLEGETREVVFVCDHAASAIDDEPPLPARGVTLLLQQNRPNPFGLATRISYVLPTRAPVRLQVFDVRGQLVETVLEEIQDAGSQSVLWHSGELDSGLYFYRLTAGDSRTSRKAIILR